MSLVESIDTLMIYRDSLERKEDVQSRTRPRWPLATKIAAGPLQPLIELARRHAARDQFDPSAVQHLFMVRGKLLPIAFLFDRSLKAAPHPDDHGSARAPLPAMSLIYAREPVWPNGQTAVTALACRGALPLFGLGLGVGPGGVPRCERPSGIN